MISRKTLLFGLVFLAGLILSYMTIKDIKPVPVSLDKELAKADRLQVLDRFGEPLSVTYQNRWNTHDVALLHEIPKFMLQAFLGSEDSRYFQHSGTDWLARGNALVRNLVNLRVVRGASTITEQVVRMLHPRPRTLWSRWLEGWEAGFLEQHHSKHEILEFYLNQVPYAAKRRGVKQAARYYFDRDLETLHEKEMLALAVLIRAPSRLDLYKGQDVLTQSLNRLALRMVRKERLSKTKYNQILNASFKLIHPGLSVTASHFVRHVLEYSDHSENKLLTTLDGRLQNELQNIVDQRLQVLRKRSIENAALLVVDHSNGEILAWVVGGAEDHDKPSSMIDSVKVYRQPGSALKPLLYALALEQGWTPATMINDSPLSESVGSGLHQYQNYSRTFYGPVSLRMALGNSLNIPALRTVQYVKTANYLSLLQQSGFTGLTRHPDYYGDGLALGNAEVSLFELVQSYAILANRGVWQPLRAFPAMGAIEKRRVFSRKTSSLIGQILSDPDARRLEFGRDSVLNLPYQTAVKTGTSSDFRDSWTMGYNDRYVVGVWMGNLDNTATDGITGSTGPGLVLRSAFSILNRNRMPRPLFWSPELNLGANCKGTGAAEISIPECAVTVKDNFTPGSPEVIQASTEQYRRIRFRQPSPGLHLAMDPRVPEDKQAFEFVLEGVSSGDFIEWMINGKLASSGFQNHFLWPLKKGMYEVQAKILKSVGTRHQTKAIQFLVK